MAPQLFAVLLLLLLAVAGAALLWQETRSRRDLLPIYGMSDAAAFVLSRLEEVPGVDRSHVDRILQTQVQYLQGLHGRDVVSGSPEAVQLVRSQLYAQGWDYAPELIETVMALEAEYLVSIGAVGEPASGETGVSA